MLDVPLATGCGVALSRAGAPTPPSSRAHWEKAAHRQQWLLHLFNMWGITAILGVIVLIQKRLMN